MNDPEDELEEDVVEAPEPEAQPEPEAEEAPEPEQSEADDEHDLYDANGRMLGKFTRTADVLKSYKALEREHGRKANEAGQQRKAMEQAGWTFDGGNAVPPKPQAAAPPPEDKPAAQAQPEAPKAPDLNEAVRTDAAGTKYNYLDMPIIPAEEWEAFRDDQGEEAYIRARATYDSRQAFRLEQHAAQQAQQEQATRQTQLAQVRSTLKQSAKDEFKLDDGFVDGVDREFEASVLPTLHPSLQGDPNAVGVAWQLFSARKAITHLQEQLAAARSGGAQAAQAGQKVIRADRGSRPTGTGTAPPAKDNGLTAEEKKFCADMKISEESYVKYNS